MICGEGFDEFIKISNELIIVTDETQKIYSVSKSFCKSFQFNYSDLLKLKFEDIFLERTGELTIKEASQSSLFVSENTSLIINDKKKMKFPVSFSQKEVKVGENEFLYYSFKNLTKNSDLKDQYQVAIDSAPNGMLMIDRQGTIVYVNNKIIDIFGHRKEELIGSPVEMIVPKETQGIHPSYIEKYCQSPKPRAMGSGRELFGVKKNSDLVPVEIGLQPIRFNNELFVMSSIVDISERKSNELEIKEKSQELQEFAYRTSHDLKTPLISIHGLAQIIQIDLERNRVDEAKINISKILRINKNLQQLVGNILTLTKVIEGEAQKDFFDFEDYISLLQYKATHLTSEYGVQIVSHFNHDFDLKINKVLLTQVLDNLIINGVKYSDGKKSDRYVELQSYSDKQFFYIKVRDNGIGIPPEKHSEVFNMFSRFHSAKVSGHGLGLYMVQKICNKLKIKISFESSKLGTSFYLKIPK